MFSRLAILLSVCWLSAAPLYAVRVRVAPSASKIPAGGFSAAPAWAGAIGLELRSGLFNPASIDFKGSVLPSLSQVDPHSPQNQLYAEPIAHYLTQELGVDLQTFQGMPAEDKRDLLLMASQEAASAIRWDASLAMTEAVEVLFTQGGAAPSMEEVEAAAKRLREFRTKYALFLTPGQLEDVRKQHIQIQEKAAALRSEKVRSKGSDIAGRLAESEEKLRAADIGVAVTDAFTGDTAGWNETEWERLQKELNKIRQLLAAGRPLRGEVGNIKFLAGPLSGLAEIKFGTNRTHRVFFKFHPQSKKVVFLKVLAREAMNKNNGYIEDLQEFRSNDVLAARMKEPPNDIPLMKKIRSSDLDIRLDP